MKSFQGRHKDLNKGEDVRNPQHLIKAKEKRLQQKMKNMSKEDRKSNGQSRPSAMDKFTGGKNVSQKAKSKILAGMRPTRAKVIIKSQGREGGFAGNKRGRGGRGGSRGRGGKR